MIQSRHGYAFPPGRAGREAVCFLDTHVCLHEQDALFLGNKMRRAHARRINARL